MTSWHLAPEKITYLSCQIFDLKSHISVFSKDKFCHKW
jgi:hypothetical protein